MCITSPAGFAASDSFRSSLEDAGRVYARPGEVVNYTCTVVDNAGTGSTFWKGRAFNCPPSNIVSLSHQLFNIGGDSGTCGAITAESVGVVDNCYTSRLMVTVSPALNGTTVECTLSGVRVVGSRTILIAGMHWIENFFKIQPSHLKVLHVTSVGQAPLLIPVATMEKCKQSNEFQ